MTALKLGKSPITRTDEEVAILNFDILLPANQKAAEKPTSLFN